MATLRRLTARVPEEVVKLPYRKLCWTRIVERLKLGRKREIEFRTDLVPSIKQAAKTSLVVYSLIDTVSTAAELPVLVTAFPTQESGHPGTARRRSLRQTC